jgi:hypothetical protein
MKLQTRADWLEIVNEVEKQFSRDRYFPRFQELIRLMVATLR